MKEEKETPILWVETLLEVEAEVEAGVEVWVKIRVEVEIKMIIKIVSVIGIGIEINIEIWEIGVEVEAIVERNIMKGKIKIMKMIGMITVTILEMRRR